MPVTLPECLPSENPPCLPSLLPSFLPSFLSIAVIVPGPPEDSLTIVIPVCPRGRSQKEAGTNIGHTQRASNCRSSLQLEGMTRVRANWSQLGTNADYLVRGRRVVRSEERLQECSPVLEFFLHPLIEQNKCPSLRVAATKSCTKATCCARRKMKSRPRRSPLVGRSAGRSF